MLKKEVFEALALLSLSRSDWAHTCTVSAPRRLFSGTNQLAKHSKVGSTSLLSDESGGSVGGGHFHVIDLDVSLAF
jgi:hypothetical protein